MFFAEETAVESWQTKRKCNMGSSQTQHKVCLNTNPWKPVIAKNVVILHQLLVTVITLRLSLTSSFFVISMINLLKVISKINFPILYSKLFAEICILFMARIDILALQDHHTKLLPFLILNFVPCILSSDMIWETTWLLHLFCFISFLNPHKIFFCHRPSDNDGTL